MAAEDAAVVVTLRANLKDYEAALKSAVRATERAAKAAETAVSGIGKKQAFAPLNDNFKKSASQLANDARIMQFQLNDIFSGLASGQGIRALQQQLGQIAQQLGGGGLRQAAGTLGTALVGMINPINLAVVAFGVAATAAASFFFESEEGAEKTAKATEAQVAALRKIADAYKDILPALDAYVTAQEKVAQAGQNTATLTAEMQKLQAAIDAAWKNLDAGDVLSDLLVDIQQNAGAAAQTVQDELLAAITKFQQAQAEGKGVQEAWNELVAKAAELDKQYGDGNNVVAESLFNMTKGLRDSITALELMKTVMDAVATSTDKVVQSINALPLGQPGFGVPLTPPTSGAGVWNPSQTQMEQAKKAREDAEKAAKEAAREAERAAEENKREAERAAKEAADKLNEAIINQTKVAVDAVTGLLGKSETANTAEINAFLKRGGVDLDAATTAWCAAFVNSALAQVGIKGTGSQVATSFATWGQAVPLGEIRRGDVLVEQRGRRPGQTGGHVGFATGQLRATAEGITQIEMISGNASDQVQTDWVEASEVIARRATDAFQVPADALQHISDASKAAAAEAKKLADEQARAAQALNQQYASIVSGALTGLVSDLRNGVEAGEAFNNMLNRILDSLIQIGIQMAVKSLFGGFGLPVAHGGGSVSHLAGGSHRQVSPLAFAGASRFASGGMVGLRPGEVPIIAHRGEIIVPNARRLAGSSGAGKVDNSVHQDNRINVNIAESGFVAANSEDAKAVGDQINRAVQVILVKESRPGGLLRRVPG